jgi:Heterokaryon incompatibility protein (HET)
MGPNERKSEENKVDRVLAEAQQHVATYMTRDGSWTAASPLSSYPEIGLSVMALGATLTRAKMRVWGENSRGFSWGHSELTVSLMRRAGWCPSDIIMLQKRLSASGLYFASLFPPRLSEMRHAEEGCNEDACNIMNVTGQRKSQYTTEHTETCDGQCNFHSASTDQLCSSLSQPETIPAFKFVTERDGDENLALIKICLEKAERYVAISHVWIEGLGNMHANAMPECQLRRLQLLVNEVCGVTDAAQSIPFWIDTLCVPQDNLLPHLRPFRDRAICIMNEVYKNAHTVLVLDTAMMTISKSATIEEQMMRFACCSWLRRLWTLQEGVLGKKIMLQLSDGAIDMVRDIVEKLRDNKIQGFFELHQTILTELMEFFWRIQLLRDHSGGPKIIKLWNACQDRTTSEAQDEAVCLAIIFGLDVKALMEEAPEKRWQCFLLQQQTFPKDLLFTSGPRMSQLGYRWAPSTFIRRTASQASKLSLSMGVGEANAAGFTIRASGFLLGRLEVPFRSNIDRFWILDEVNEAWYFVADRRNFPPWSQLVRDLPRQDLGVIVNQDLKSHGFALGVLVKMRDTSGTSDDTLRVEFVATVNICREDAIRWPTLESWKKEETTQQTQISESCRTTVGRLVETDQLWCVG